MPRRIACSLLLLAACGGEGGPPIEPPPAPPPVTPPPPAPPPTPPPPPDPGPPSITHSTLPLGITGTPYRAELSATAGLPPLTWSLAGALPAGLTFVADPPAIEGTPSAPAAASLLITVEDAAMRRHARSLHLDVVDTLILETTALDPADFDTPYRADLSARGGRRPYTWTIAQGSLPDGLSIDRAAITGSPRASGTFMFTIEVTDAVGLVARRELTLEVGEQLAIHTASLPAGQQGDPYRAAISARGGTGGYTWTLISAPLGLTLETTPGDATSTLAGAPAVEGLHTVDISVEDSAGHVASATFSLSLIGPYTIATPILPSLAVGRSFLLPLATLNGVPPDTFTLAAGVLPDGLAFDASGTFSGTPNESGLFTPVIETRDANGHTASLALVLEVINELSIDTTALPNADVTTPYAATVTASGGTGQYVWSASGLPAGLTISVDGTISGSTRDVGSFEVELSVGDGDVVRAATLPLIVADNFRITTTTLPTAFTGRPYTASIDAADGALPYSFSAGTLPAGIIVAQNGPTALLLEGTPERPETVAFEVIATDDAGVSRTASFTIEVETVEILGPASIDLRAGTPASWTLSAAGGTPPYLWSIAAGALPEGLSLDAITGEISGTPVRGGVSSATIEARESGGGHGRRELSFEVEQVDIITTSLPPYALPYSATITAANGVEPYTFAITAGALPPEWTMTGATIAGSAMVIGTYNFSVTVTDQLGNSDTQAYSIAGAPAADPHFALWPTPATHRSPGEFLIHTSSVTDLITGLSWSSTPFPAATLAAASAHCASLSEDWRAPTWIEQISVAEGALGSELASVFTPTTRRRLWTTTAGRSVVQSGAIDAADVYCVRSDPVLDRPRYTIDGVLITNHFTGLQWSAESGPNQDPAHVELYCQVSSDGGFADWRWPTLKELAGENTPGSLGYFGYFDQPEIALDSWSLAYDGVLAQRSRSAQFCVREPQTSCGPLIADMSRTAATAIIGQSFTLDGSASSAGACTPSLTWSISPSATAPGASVKMVYLQDDRAAPLVDVMFGVPDVYTVTLTARVDGAVATDTRTIAVGGPSSCSFSVRTTGRYVDLVANPIGGTPPYTYGFVRYFSPYVRGPGVYSFGSSDTYAPLVDNTILQDWYIVGIDAAGCVWIDYQPVEAN